MSTDPTSATYPQVGWAYADRDPRNPGRIVRVFEVNSRRVKVVNEAHPANPDAVGRSTHISIKGITGRRWRRVEED